MAAEALTLNGRPRLPLGADKQDQRTLRGDLGQVLLGPQQTANGFADVDDVNPVLLGIDIGCHLGIPPAGPVAEVDARFNQFFDESIAHEPDSL